MGREVWGGMCRSRGVARGVEQEVWGQWCGARGVGREVWGQGCGARGVGRVWQRQMQRFQLSDSDGPTFVRVGCCAAIRAGPLAGEVWGVSRAAVPLGRLGRTANPSRPPCADTRAALGRGGGRRGPAGSLGGPLAGAEKLESPPLPAFPTLPLLGRRGRSRRDEVPRGRRGGRIQTGIYSSRDEWASICGAKDP